MNYAIAVLDLGMTNKKLIVYDEDFHQLESVSRGFEPLLVEGIETHDLQGIREWFLDMLSALSGKYPISVISVTAHGASFVCVDEKDEPCVPSVFYTHEPGEAFHERFYAMAGSPIELQKSTGTPNLKALINPAKGILFAKERFPEAFARTRRILFYPQFFGLMLSGAAGAEPTYVGCHTYLWDFAKDSWSSVTDALGIRDLLPEKVEPSWKVLGKIKPEIAARTGLKSGTMVTMGIHDSNASLIPYLAGERERDFVLDSTGTWCVLMHPQKHYAFEPEDLGKVVFYNRAATLDPVKTAIFLGGLEFETYSGLLMEMNGRKDMPAFDIKLYKKVIREKSVFILPELVFGSGQFTGSSPRAVEEGKFYPLAGIRDGSSVPPFFMRFEEAMAALDLSLVLQTEVALNRAGLRPGSDIFIEGGFRKNKAYACLLASLERGCAVNLTDIAQATSLGAAMMGKMAMERLAFSDLEGSARIEKKLVEPESFEGFEEYRSAFLELALTRQGAIHQDRRER